MFKRKVKEKGEKINKNQRNLVEKMSAVMKYKEKFKKL